MLVTYQGGGYDGCIWEPNFIWVEVDKEGNIEKLEKIYVSGALGKFYLNRIKTLKDIKEDKDTIEIIDVAMDEFAKYMLDNYMFNHAQRVFEWLAHHKEIKADLWVECPRCGNIVPTHEICPIGHIWLGGLAYDAADYCCNECEYELTKEEEGDEEWN